MRGGTRQQGRVREGAFVWLPAAAATSHGAGVAALLLMLRCTVMARAGALAGTKTSAIWAAWQA